MSIPGQVSGITWDVNGFQGPKKWLILAEILDRNGDDCSIQKLGGYDKGSICRKPWDMI
jgi:CYTH domain-containing protein